MQCGRAMGKAGWGRQEALLKLQAQPAGPGPEVVLTLFLGARVGPHAPRSPVPLPMEAQTHQRMCPLPSGNL